MNLVLPSQALLLLLCQVTGLVALADEWTQVLDAVPLDRKVERAFFSQSEVRLCFQPGEVEKGMAAELWQRAGSLVLPLEKTLDCNISWSSNKTRVVVSFQAPQTDKPLHLMLRLTAAKPEADKSKILAAALLEIIPRTVLADAWSGRQVFLCENREAWNAELKRQCVTYKPMASAVLSENGWQGIVLYPSHGDPRQALKSLKPGQVMVMPREATGPSSAERWTSGGGVLVLMDSLLLDTAPANAETQRLLARLTSDQP